MYKRLLKQRLTKLAKQFPAVSVVGPRQSGKTTLVQKTFSKYEYVSLEDLDTREFATEDPRGFLKQYQNGVILDEIQRVPDLFSYLQTEIDRNRKPGQWILTGSQNFLLLSGISQTLAGRTAICHLFPLTMIEQMGSSKAPDLSWQEQLFRGFYPEINWTQDDVQEWYSAYLQTYVQRDVRDFARIGDLTSFSRFIRLCAGRSGQLLSMNNLAVDASISQPTAKSWLSILESSGLIFQLQPYHTNFSKRLVKTTKLYWLDTGLLCHLLRIRRPQELFEHPFRGAIFESFVISEIYKLMITWQTEPDIYFWRDRSGHEVDAIVEIGQHRWPLEIKSSETISRDYLKGLNFWSGLAGNDVPGILVYTGNKSYKRSENQILPWYGIGKWLLRMLKNKP